MTRFVPRVDEHGNLLQPTPQEIRAAREHVGDTLARAARRVHLGAHSRWAEFEREDGSRPIDMARWELYLLLTGQHPRYRVIERDEPPRRRSRR